MPTSMTIAQPIQSSPDATGRLVTVGGYAFSDQDMTGWTVTINTLDPEALPEFNTVQADVSPNTLPPVTALTWSATVTVAYGHCGRVYATLYDRNHNGVIKTDVRDVNCMNPPAT